MLKFFLLPAVVVLVVASGVTGFVVIVLVVADNADEVIVSVESIIADFI